MDEPAQRDEERSRVLFKLLRPLSESEARDVKVLTADEIKELLGKIKPSPLYAVCSISGKRYL